MLRKDGFFDTQIIDIGVLQDKKGYVKPQFV